MKLRKILKEVSDETIIKYRDDDGVSFVRRVETDRRIQIIKNSFENLTINRYEDNLKEPSNNK